jgi:hypothetical protein
VSHAVPALGAALLTAAGSVWYLPALADLRAGADRPLSRRFAAAACLGGWTTVAAVALLLLVVETWAAPATVAAAGTSFSGCLRIRAGVQHGREDRETARQWAALRHEAPRAATTAHGVFATLLALGLLAGTATATVLLTSGIENREDGVRAVAASAGVVAVFLTVALTRLYRTRRSMSGDPRSRW